MTTVTRQIATADSARIVAAVRNAGLRVAYQVDGDVTTLIFHGDEAGAAADAMAAELTH